MFVEIDDYVVNLAAVDNIAISCCVDDTEENPWDLSIEIGDDFELEDPVWLRQGFSTENHAKRFRQGVIRRPSPLESAQPRTWMRSLRWPNSQAESTLVRVKG